MARLVAPLVVIVVLGLLLMAVLLPSSRDASFAAWWNRIRRDLDTFGRSLLALVLLAVIVRYVLLPLLGWR